MNQGIYYAQKAFFLPHRVLQSGMQSNGLNDEQSNELKQGV